MRLRLARRAFTLMLVLLLSTILLILGLGLMSERSSQYRAAMLASQSAQAEALAEAGLEDARVKLSKDADFPPQGAEDQRLYSYTEQVENLSGQAVGSFEVTVDQRWRDEPWQVVRLTSTGTIGTAGAPRAQFTATVELDMAKYLRSDPPGVDTPNPKFFQVLSRE